MTKKRVLLGLVVVVVVGVVVVTALGRSRGDDGVPVEVAAVGLAGCDSGGDGGEYHAVIVGVSQYRVPAFDLTYADDELSPYGSPWVVRVGVGVGL